MDLSFRHGFVGSVKMTGGRVYCHARRFGSFPSSLLLWIPADNAFFKPAVVAIEDASGNHVTIPVVVGTDVTEGLFDS